MFDKRFCFYSCCSTTQQHHFTLFSDETRSDMNNCILQITKQWNLFISNDANDAKTANLKQRAFDSSPTVHQLYFVPFQFKGIKPSQWIFYFPFLHPQIYYVIKKERNFIGFYPRYWKIQHVVCKECFLLDFYELRNRLKKKLFSLASFTIVRR